MLLIIIIKLYFRHDHVHVRIKSNTVLFSVLSVFAIIHAWVVLGTPKKHQDLLWRKSGTNSKPPNQMYDSIEGATCPCSAGQATSRLECGDVLAQSRPGSPPDSRGADERPGGRPWHQGSKWWRGRHPPEWPPCLEGCHPRQARHQSSPVTTTLREDM